uniref:Terpene synthase n=1 Tax=Scapania nemorea TaxID=41848 RepID=A0A1J0CQ90_SCANE|nr:terpene synthase 2 [Scapania nemorea]
MATEVVAAAAEPRFAMPTQPYRLPSYSPPYPVVINPHFSSTVFRERIDRWLKQLKVDTIFSPKIYKMLVDMDVSGLPARIFTEASELGLEWSCKFFLMLWIWDDTLDSTDTGKSPEAALSPLLEVHLMMMWSFPDDPVLRTRLEPFLNHLEGPAREEKTRHVESVLAEARTKPGTVYPKPILDIICNVYLELWKDVVTTASPEFCLRLAHYNQQWFLGILKETENRKFKTLPSSIEHYIEIRKGSSAVPPTVVLVDFVYGLNTPDSWFYSPEMQRIVEAINDIVSWHNDIWSFKREVLVEKDSFNMVLAISVHRKVSYNEAADITLRMIYERIADLEQAARELESVSPPEYMHNFDLYMLTGYQAHMTDISNLCAINNWYIS